MNLFSSIGQKFIMGSTGIILLLFITGHLIGNLGIYAGADFFNAYSEFLQSKFKIIWFARIILLFCFLFHIFTSIRLTRKNRLARPVGYANKNFIKSTLASRVMLLGGCVILAFFIFHIAHLTMGCIYPEFHKTIDQLGRHDVYAMTVLSFKNLWLSAIYIVAQIFLAMHISHGFSSASQTFGITCSKFAKLIKISGNFLAILIFSLYISIPISVLLGVTSL